MIVRQRRSFSEIYSGVGMWRYNEKINSSLFDSFDSHVDSWLGLRSESI